MKLHSPQRALQWLFGFFQASRKQLKSPKTMHKVRKQRHKMCRWREHPLLANPRALSLRGARCQPQPQASDRSLSLGKVIPCKMRHFIIFKWDVHSAALGMCRSLHDSSTLRCFPSGQGNLTQILPVFLWPKIFMKKFYPVF